MRGSAQRTDRWGQKWRFVNKNAAISASTPNAIGATPARIAAVTAGIQIKLLANQAVWIRRYTASFVQVANDASLFALGGQFMIQVAPFSLTSAPFVYPWLDSMSVASSGSTTGQFLSNVGLNYALFDDWLEFDDVLLTAALSLLPGPIQLQAALEVQNTAAAAKTVTAGESAVWEIWEQVRN